MHERTERAIARLLFTFCCAVPTLVVMFSIFVSWLPWVQNARRDELERYLSSETEFLISIDETSRPAPGKLQIENLTLREPEYQNEIARVRTVTWLEKSDSIGVLLGQPELQSSQLDQIWELLHDRFLCRPDRTNIPIEMAASDLTIHSINGSLTLRDMVGQIVPKSQFTEATVHAKPATASSGSPIKISIRRNRDGNRPQTQWSFESGSTPLPCSALSEYLPLMNRLGAEAEFQGIIQWTSEANGQWTIDLGGRFTEIDLAQLCESWPHRLTAKSATLQLDRCYIHPGQKINLSGTLIASEGWAGQSLLQALNEHLGLDVDARAMQPKGSSVPFDMFAVHFGISDDQLTINGSCGINHHNTLPPSVAMFVGQNVIAQANEITVPSVRLMRIFARGESELVPVARHTQNLIGLLIAPKNRLPHTDTPVVPASHISELKTWTGNEPIRQQ